jgi:hypothetical protein
MATTVRRERLERFLELAQAYRGWNRKELARALGRDTTRLVPQSGLPKLDLLMDLSRALDWAVEDVARHLWEPGADAPRDAPDAPPRDARHDARDFAAADARVATALDDARFEDAIAGARHARRLAASPDDRALAWTRAATAWAGLGRFRDAVRATRRGLGEPGTGPARRLRLQADLAAHHLALGRLPEARSMAHDVLARCDHDAGPPGDRRSVIADATTVRGHGTRRLMTIETGAIGRCADLARGDLVRARDLHLELADEIAETSGAGSDAARHAAAHTCLGGLIEIEVALERSTATDALDRFDAGLEAVLAPDPRGERAAAVTRALLRSCGWWCVFAGNVLLRHVDDERAVQERLASFAGRAGILAERLDDWALRERAVVMEVARRRRFREWTGVEPEHTVDRKGIRVITGLMGRFPSFHATGWRLLEAARVVDPAR